MELYYAVSPGKLVAYGLSGGPWAPRPGFDGPRRSRPRTASRDGERALPANPGPYWSGGGAASVATRRRCTVAFL